MNAFLHKLTGRDRNPRAGDCHGSPGIQRRQKKQQIEFARQIGGKLARIFCVKRLWFGLWFVVCAGWLSILLSGCTPQGPDQSADKQEPHYVLGERRVDAMDYRGAIRAFREALEVDPHSAAAHFQLAWLYDAKVPDPAAAIYHYERYLKLEPNAGNAALVKQRIEACKQKLAEDVLGLPSMPAAQHQIEQLMAKNEQLQNENRLLRKKNQQFRVDLNRWSEYYASLLAARSNLPTGNPNPAPSAQAAAAAQPAASMAPSWQTHTVVAGETAVHIAREYGISLEALLAANPGLEPRRMPVGLVLKIPLPRDSASPFLEVRR